MTQRRESPRAGPVVAMYSVRGPDRRKSSTPRRIFFADRRNRRLTWL